MRGRGGRRRRALGFGLGTVAAVGLAACGTGEPSPPVAAARAVAAPRDPVALTIGHAQAPVPHGFLGLSIEFSAIRAYTGSDPRAIDPVFEALVRGLSPGQSPVLRIGGNSTDVSWTPGPGVAATPPHAGYELRPSWYATTAALTHALGAQLILGVNVASGRPAVAHAEVLAALRAFGRGAIEALELGNEPNLYPTIAHYRPPAYDPGAYQQETRAVAAALPSAIPALTFVGPALSAGPDAADTEPWTSASRTLLHGPPALRALTIHRYPLKNCYTARSARQYPSIAHLLSPYATVGLAAGVRRWVAIAHGAGAQLRVDELNSAACRGRPGVSDAFASALWAPDALFSLLAAGVDAVNLHTLPDSAYEPFALRRRAGRWEGQVRPMYYGLALFARAAPAGSRLAALTGATHTTRLSTWATRGPDGSARLLVVDKSPRRGATVELPAPAGAGGPVSVQRLTAPGVRARGGVALGGRTFGRWTSTGTLAPARPSAPGRAPDGRYVVHVRAASAALVTFAAGRTGR